MFPKRKVNQEQFQALEKRFDESDNNNKREHNITRWIVGIGFMINLGIAGLLYNANNDQIKAYRDETRTAIESYKLEMNSIKERNSQQDSRTDYLYQQNIELMKDIKRSYK